MAAPEPVQSAALTLTDGTGVSKFTVPKAVKDFIVDFVKTTAATYTALGIVGVENAIDDPHKALIGVIGALFSAVYRAVLLWGNAS